MSSNLVIFDIDGTLTQTGGVDLNAFTQAFIEYFEVDKINNNWAEYCYSTDSGIAMELFEKYLYRKPSVEEMQAIKNKFFDLLELQIRNNNSHCRPLLGAQTIFGRIAALSNWDIAIATGCWRGSALIKLRHAGLPYHNIPLGCADDDMERYEIINIATQRAKKHYQQEQYKTIVYVGDRFWDYRASQKLGINFIGVGEEFFAGKPVDFPVVQDYSSNNILIFLNGFVKP